METQIRLCTPDDLPTLQAISRRTFAETFADRNSPQDLQAYLDRAYHPEKLRWELEHPQMEFYFLYAGGRLAGYLKVNDAEAQTEFQDPNALEIERIYVAQEAQGLGLGSRLMEHAVQLTDAKKKQFIWLGVWEQNEKALAFYRRYGFYPIGSHTFWVGTDQQTDRLLRKDLRLSAPKAPLDDRPVYGV